MTFDRDLAVQVAKSRDRDTAPFFAGRRAEIEAFDDAVDEAGRYTQATFRIYEGAPGCGKTALAAHLAETRADKLVFVKVDPEDLADSKTLSERIRTAAIEHGHIVARAGTKIVELASSHLRNERLADLTRDAVAKMSARGTRLVLHLDEAQAMVPESANMIRKLHTTGIGVPCVVIMTGAAQTEVRVGAIPGMSRLGSNPVVKMGAMSLAECADSTIQMLDTLNVADYSDVTAAGRDSLAKLTAELSHEWPQHLHCAQVSLCEELLRVDGVAGNVDSGSCAVAVRRTAARVLRTAAERADIQDRPRRDAPNHRGDREGTTTPAQGHVATAPALRGCHRPGGPVRRSGISGTAARRLFRGPDREGHRVGCGRKMGDRDSIDGQLVGGGDWGRTASGEEAAR